jgi:hypothetical protein
MRTAVGRALVLGIGLALASVAAACGSNDRTPTIPKEPASAVSASVAPDARPADPTSSARRERADDDAALESACREFSPSSPEHVAIVRVDEDRWEDRGPNRLGIHHWKATILRSCNGAWRVSERIAFMQYVDWSPTRAAAHPNAEAGKRLVLRTQNHATVEFEISTGALMPLPDAR